MNKIQATIIFNCYCESWQYLHSVFPVSIGAESVFSMNSYDMAKSGDFVGIVIAQVEDKSVEFTLERDQIHY